MTIDTFLRQTLAAFAPLHDIGGTVQIYNDTAQQGDTYPYVVFQQMADETPGNHDGARIPLHLLVYAFSCHSQGTETMSGADHAWAMAEQVYEALNAAYVPGTFGPTFIDRKFCTFFELERVYRAQIDVRFWERVESL